MALLVTSCTMGRRPRQLLTKGPAYLRTKTNTKMFTEHRRSAVELLAASKAQFVKSTVDLSKDCRSDNRSGASSTERKSPRRSKSEYDLTRIERELCEEDCNSDIDHPRTVEAQRKPTAKPACCINGTAGRKINMSNQNNLDLASSRNQKTPSVVNQQTDGRIVTESVSSCVDVNPIMSEEEERMVVDNVMTASMDLSSTQEVDMDYKTSFVQRSHSDLSCQHSRNSSLVADRNSARFSRASADLEKFFNGMGIERNILDPMLRRQDTTSQRDAADIFESISSLDSPDTRSVCSGVSKLSEKTFSSSECLERTLQSTSVVERNARIIKWLCNIKKAKQPLTNE